MAVSKWKILFLRGKSLQWQVHLEFNCADIDENYSTWLFVHSDSWNHLILDPNFSTDLY